MPANTYSPNLFYNHDRGFNASTMVFALSLVSFAVHDFINVNPPAGVVEAIAECSVKLAISTMLAGFMYVYERARNDEPIMRCAL